MKLRASFSAFQCFIFCVLLLCSRTHAAQFIEIQAEIESTSWSRERTSSGRTFNTRFIIGTNLWFFEGDFALNATHRYWFTGTNIVQETVITSRLQERSVPGPVISRVPEIGKRTVRVHTRVATEPLRGFAYVSWMAFCSGNFLKSDGREILLPFDIRRAVPRVADKTINFEDALGLPKQFELFGPDQQELCEYKVEQSTNFLGWNLPLSFKLVEHPHDLQRGVEAVGKVTSIRPGDAPVLPPEVLKEMP